MTSLGKTIGRLYLLLLFMSAVYTTRFVFDYYSMKTAERITDSYLDDVTEYLMLRQSWQEYSDTMEGLGYTAYGVLYTKQSDGTYEIVSLDTISMSGDDTTYDALVSKGNVFEITLRKDSYTFRRRRSVQ